MMAKRNGHLADARARLVDVGYPQAGYRFPLLQRLQGPASSRGRVSTAASPSQPRRPGPLRVTMWSRSGGATP